MSIAASVQQTTLAQQLADNHQALSVHPVFASVQSLDDLRCFMEWHVFAVWDFMSLVKRLQQELTCITVPWVPPLFPKAARLINDIVLAEESDEALGGGHMSHFDLYLEAMTALGADTGPITRFIAGLRRGENPIVALETVGAPAAVTAFVRSTLTTALDAPVHRVAASFFHGRENVIPDMFSRLIETWGLAESDAPAFYYYLQRHIELDADEHGPAAQAMIEELTGGDERLLEEAYGEGVAATSQRLVFWDALEAVLKGR